MFDKGGTEEVLQLFFLGDIFDDTHNPDNLLFFIQQGRGGDLQGLLRTISQGVRVMHDNGKAGGKDLSMDALLLKDVVTGTGKRGVMQDLITFFAHDFLICGGAQITERLIGKDDGVVLVDNKDSIGEMVKDGILILW
jgi:hypothetical protein